MSFENYECEQQMNLFDFINKEEKEDFSKYMHPPIDIENEENTMPKQASKQASKQA